MRFVILLSLITWADAQNGRGPPSHDHSGRGWDIRLAVPGEPGNDYPTLGNIPRTGFSCAGRDPGYYADVEAGCQVFRICTIGSTYGFQSFLCPNGTLFNQEVFVCDWWMNVKCRPNEKLISSDRFGNLKLGPQLMKDVKKMLTHTMRNPYDKNTMRGNLIVMQEYIPPAGQLFPNGALIAGPERTPNNVYVPARQIQQPNFNPNYNLDSSYAASTPDTRYIPAGFTNQAQNTDAEIFQRQRQNTPFVQNNRIQSTPATQYIQQARLTNAQHPNHNYNQVNAQYNQRSPNTITQNGLDNQRGQFRQGAQPTDARKPQQSNVVKQNQIISNIKQQQQYNDKQQYTYRQPTPTLASNDLRQNLVSPEPTVITKQLTYSKLLQEPKPGRPKSRITVKTWVVKPKSGKQVAEPTPYTFNTPAQTPAERLVEESSAYFYTRPTSSPQLARQAQENPASYVYNRPTPQLEAERVVNEDSQKPYVYNNPNTPPPARIVQNNEPNSYVYDRPTTPPPARIVQNNEPNSYVYNRPTTPPPARLVQDNEPTPYVYNRPTTPPPARIVQNNEPTPYVYNRPTTPPPARIVQNNEPTPYVYNRPTTPPPARIVQNNEPTPYVYNRPTTPPPARIVQNNEPKPYVYNRPTVAARQIVTTRNPPTRSYLPPAQTQLPTQTSKILVPTTFKPSSRLYLPPPPTENAPILSTYLAPLQQEPYRSGQLQAAPSTPIPTNTSPNNENHEVLTYNVIRNPNRNLTFTDILTKEKLDLTVNDIVRDTGSVLQTAAPPRFGQYVQGSVNEPDSSYLPAEIESGEDLTSKPPSSTSASKSARLVAEPARDLEPPAESVNSNQNVNQITRLPFYKESSIPNTIERTVSLKITLPERIASYIFRGGNATDYDNLEILNTGSSNYLVLSNNMINEGGNFIPIGKLSENNNSNVSDSQALVFSFLADSLNAAKKYTNVVKQDVITSPTQSSQTSNLNNEDISHIANQISQLTSSQFSNSNSPNTATVTQTTTTSSQANQFLGSTNNIQNSAPIQSAQYNIAPSVQTEQLYATPYQINSNPNGNLLDSTQNAIYSAGQLYQLPVPEVTNQIYNRPQSANLMQSNQKKISPQVTNQNNLPNNNLGKQSSTEVEIVQSKTLPLTPAKLQVPPSDESESFYSQESLNSLLNSDNGIQAHLQDKIVGVLPHPLEGDKLVTYEKDQSYYLFTKLDNNGQAPGGNNIVRSQNTKSTRGSIPSVITFQFVPSVSYQLEDEKEQQKLLNSFNIDDFGAPVGAKSGNLVQETNVSQPTLVTNVDFSVEHPPSRQISQLYMGPSSYLAPQGSVGSLPAQINQPFSSKLEELDDKSSFNGYPRLAPVRRFAF